MNETMQYWADNYQLGIGLITGILILVYTVISVGAILLYRYRKGYVSVLGVIPVVQIGLYFMGKPKKEKPKKKQKTKNGVSDTNTEVKEEDFDDFF